jgi:hypothetical protein
MFRPPGCHLQNIKILEIKITIVNSFLCVCVCVCVCVFMCIELDLSLWLLQPTRRYKMLTSYKVC